MSLRLSFMSYVRFGEPLGGSRKLTPESYLLTYIHARSHAHTHIHTHAHTHTNTYSLIHYKILTYIHPHSSCTHSYTFSHSHTYSCIVILFHILPQTHINTLTQIH